MARIVRRHFADVVGLLSSIAPLDLERAGTTADGLFLCALGFEPRCLTLPGHLSEIGYRSRRSAYLKYATNLDDNNLNLSELEHHLHVVSTPVDSLDADAADFPIRLRSLLDLVVSEAESKPASVTLDISVMANRLLLRSMKVLLEYDICVRIIYSEAGVYHPTIQEYEQDPARWTGCDSLGLERGVSEVMPSIDHPGHALDPLPDCLILFPSFKPERSRAVISFVDPSLLANPAGKVVWVLGEPHLLEDRWRLDLMKRINGIGEGTPQYLVSTFDYRETLRALEDLYSEKSERHTITVSPLGSKMQALGIALFCYMHPDVRVIFSIPTEYNAFQYSEGCKAMWEIKFGNLSELRRNLGDVGRLRVEE